MKKRIALVVNTLSGGGAERTVSNLSRGLSEKYDVDIVVNDTVHITYPYTGRLLSLDMPAEAPRMGSLYQLRALWKRTGLLRRLKQSGEYAAVISFSEMTNLSNVLSGSRGARTIASVRNSVGKRKKQGLRQKAVLSLVMPFVCRRADLTVSCSREIEEELTTHYGLSRRKSAVIYNGLELSRIREQAAVTLPETELFAGKKRIVTVGRMTGQKGHWHLLKAVKQLRDDGIPAALILLGDGELRPKLEEAVRRLGLGDCVSMPGFVDNPYHYMARADAVVLPSMYEGFSNVLLEAMACGAPVISTDHRTGAREILAPDTDFREKTTGRIDECAYGILVPVCEGDIGETDKPLSREETLMAEAIRRLLMEDELAARYREASLRRAEQMELTAVCRQWIDAIEAR